jgi:integrase
VADHSSTPLTTETAQAGLAPAFVIGGADARRMFDETRSRFGRGDTYASWLVQRGASLFKAQELLGHADSKMTMKYAKLDPRRVADDVAAVFDALALERRITERAV